MGWIEAMYLHVVRGLVFVSAVVVVEEGGD